MIAHLADEQDGSSLTAAVVLFWQEAYQKGSQPVVPPLTVRVFRS